MHGLELNARIGMFVFKPIRLDLAFIRTIILNRTLAIVLGMADPFDHEITLGTLSSIGCSCKCTDWKK